MTTGADVVPPAGFIAFCAAHLDQCQGTPGLPAAIAFTAQRQAELAAVQNRVNRTVRPRAEPANAWDYPVDGTGDCNRFALAKQRALLALGWPRAALLLATALTEHGEGHLVLVAHTDRGDYVLDNRIDQVVDWTALPYRWLARQSGKNPALWVAIAGRRVAAAAAGVQRTLR